MVAYSLNEPLPVVHRQPPAPAAVPPAEAAAPVTVERLDGLDALDRLEPVWNRTVERAGLTHPFASYEWVRSWCETQIDPSALHVYVARAGREITGLAPTIERRAGPGGCVGIRQGVSCAHTPRLDFVVAARHAETWRTLWHELGPHGLESLELRDLAQDSPTLAAIEALAREDGLPVGRRLTLDCPWVQLPGSWDEYVRQMRRNLRKTLRARRQRLAHEGTIEFETIRTRDGLHEALADAFELEAAAWKGSAGTAINRHPQLVAFYTRLAERTADRGWLRLQFIRVADRRIAFGFSLQYAGRLYSMKTGYDPTFAACSPGQLFFEMSMRTACDEGVAIYDLLGARDAWKLEWTDLTQPHYLLSVFPDTVSGRALHSARYRMVPAIRRSRAYAAARDFAHRVRRRRGAAAQRHVR